MPDILKWLLLSLGALIFLVILLPSSTNLSFPFCIRQEFPVCDWAQHLGVWLSACTPWILQLTLSGLLSQTPFFNLSLPLFIVSFPIVLCPFPESLLQIHWIIFSHLSFMDTQDVQTPQEVFPEHCKTFNSGFDHVCFNQLPLDLKCNSRLQRNIHCCLLEKRGF